MMRMIYGNTMNEMECIIKIKDWSWAPQFNKSKQCPYNRENWWTCLFYNRAKSTLKMYNKRFGTGIWLYVADESLINIIQGLDIQLMGT